MTEEQQLARSTWKQYEHATTVRHDEGKSPDSTALQGQYGNSKDREPHSPTLLMSKASKASTTIAAEGENQKKEKTGQPREDNSLFPTLSRAAVGSGDDDYDDDSPQHDNDRDETRPPAPLDNDNGRVATTSTARPRRRRGQARYQQMPNDAAPSELVAAALRPRQPPQAEGLPMMVSTFEVMNFDTWHEAFLLRAVSNRGSWGFEMPVTRSEVCDDKRTLVLRSTKNPNRVMLVMVDVNIPKSQQLMDSAKIQKLQKATGVKPETQVVKAAVDAPSPEIGNSDMVIWMQVADFDVWSKGFWDFEVPQARQGAYALGWKGSWEGAASKTGSWVFEVFRGIVGGKYGGPNHVGITIFDVDKSSLDVLSHPNCKKLTGEETKVRNIKDKVLGEMPETKVRKFMADLPDSLKPSSSQGSKGKAATAADETKEEEEEEEKTAGALPIMVVTMEVKDFDTWQVGFALRAHSKTGSWGFEVVPRGEGCDDEHTLVLRSTKNPNRIMLVLFCVQTEKLLPVMHDSTLQEHLGEKTETMAIKAAIDPVGPEVGRADIVVWMQVADFDAWSIGFWESASNKTGSWGFEMPMTQYEFLGESRTEVFRGVAGGKYGGPNHVGITCFDVDKSLLHELFRESPDTKVLKCMVGNGVCI